MAFDREEFYREVGYRLQVARKRKSLSQDDIARELGIPRATYANVESGRQRVSLDVIWKIAAVLRLPIDKLVPEPISPSPSPSEQSTVPQSGTAWVDIVLSGKR